MVSILCLIHISSTLLQCWLPLLTFSSISGPACSHFAEPTSETLYFCLYVSFFSESVSPTSATFNDSELQPFLGCHTGAFNKVLHSFCSFLLILPCRHHLPLFPPVISPFSEGKVYRCTTTVRGEMGSRWCLYAYY